MHFFKKFNRRAGFTLVELCFVMAVSAIVGTMVVTFMIFISNQQAEISNEAKCIEEITAVQKEVTAWIKKYDSKNYTITAPGNSRLEATCNGTLAGKITFAGGQIKVDNVAKTNVFENITSVTFYFLDGKNAVKVTISYGTSETQDLIFSLFSKTTRARSVENRS